MLRVPRTAAATLALLLTATGTDLRAQQQAAPAADAPAESALAARLRTLYFQQDFEGAAREGARLGAAAADDPAARAWHVIGMARAALEKEAVAAAEEMAARWPDDAWTHVAGAIAAAYDNRNASGIELARRARETDPGNPYAWWALGFLLHRDTDYDGVVAMVDSVFPHRFPWAELLVLRANAAMVQAGMEQDSLRQRAHALFAEARERDPSNVNAHFFPASNLVNANRMAEAMPLLERTLEMAPYSPNVLSVYARAVEGLTELPRELRRDSVAAVVERVLEARPDHPGALSNAAAIHRMLERRERALELEARILRDAPESGEAEVVMVSRHRALADSIERRTVADSAAAEARLTRAMWEFVGRPVHRRANLLGDVYLSLFHRISGDSTVSDADLLRVAQGVARHNRWNPYSSHSDPPAALAERGVHFREAEAIVREGLELVGPFLAEREGLFKSPGDLADAEDRLMAIHYGALGWIYLHEGRLEEAEAELERAHELNRRSAPVLFYLGQLAERKGLLPEAEIHYSRGYGQEVYGGARRSTAALESVYRRMHGSMDGWDAYLAQLAERERRERRARVAEARIADPKPLPDFRLEWLHGGTFAASELAGKVGVINFWGVWCGPCVKEAPDIQRFHERFRDDPDVVFLTIDNDADAEMVRTWMAEKKFDFPVLVDDGFVRDAGVQAFPTTWFVDRDGRIAFSHMGASDVVYEEFVWRVELLLEGEGAGADAEEVAADTAGRE